MGDNYELAMDDLKDGYDEAIERQVAMQELPAYIDALRAELVAARKKIEELDEINDAYAVELPKLYARMKALGAAEALEDIAKDAGIDGGKAYLVEVVYREFPDRLTMKVGVVEAADIMDRAARLRREAGE